jgi:hypothetical protein
MPNANTIASISSGFMQGSIAPLQIGASTVEAVFVTNKNPITGAGGAPAVVSAAEGVIPSYYANGRPFKVTAWGTVTTGASETVVLTLYQVPAAIVAAGSAGTVANNHSLKASSARTVATTTAPFYIDGTFQYDSGSQRLLGLASIAINGLVDAGAATTIVTGLVGDIDLNFAVSATMGTGNAADVIVLGEIAISQV